MGRGNLKVGGDPKCGKGCIAWRASGMGTPKTGGGDPKCGKGDPKCGKGDPKSGGGPQMRGGVHSMEGFRYGDPKNWGEGP